MEHGERAGLTMEWLNIPVSVIDSEEVVGSEPVDRATWLLLLRYCCGQENGGVIRGARQWGDRRWQQLCRVTHHEVMRESPLWVWDGDDLRVTFYFREKEAEVRRLRGQASAAAHARWKADRDAKAMPGGMPGGIGEGTPDGNPEENRREEKGRGADATAIPSPSKTSKGVETAGLLAEFGLAASPRDIQEWRGGLNRVARCRSLGEAQAFLRWALTVCQAQGVEVEHWRHVRVLAREWNDGARDAHWKAA